MAGVPDTMPRWLGMRGSILAAAFSTSLAVYVVYWQEYDASLTGFLLTMASTYTSPVHAGVSKLRAFTTNQLGSAHRLYTGCATLMSWKYKVRRGEVGGDSIDLPALFASGNR